jgi:hypothetical protein
MPASQIPMVAPAPLFAPEAGFRLEMAFSGYKSKAPEIPERNHGCLHKSDLLAIPFKYRNVHPDIATVW